MKLRDYAFDANGTPLNGATVEVYAAGGVLPAAPSITTDASGAFEFSALAPGEYDVKIASSDGSLVYWRKANIAVQVQKIVALDGITAPLENASIDTTMFKPNAVGNATVNISDTNVFTGTSGSVADMLGGMARTLKSATGQTNMVNAPISLTTLDTHASRHATGGADPITPAMIGAAAAGDVGVIAAHAATHATGGTDPVTPVAIGAADSAHNHDASYALTNHNHDNVYPKLFGYSGSGITPPANAVWKVQAGSVVTGASNGVASITFQNAFIGILSIMCTNGDANGRDCVIQPADSSTTGFSARVTNYDGTLVTDTVRINYIAFGW